jgi:diaminohydroxyphosphoribosylaminopyrimidine deaminase/5-amino-6-(5-phosphoribosylamino)uracil reductase
MTTTKAEQAAMRRALVIAATPGVPLGPNPRVGCVLLADDGSSIAEGHHQGAGTPHAEAAALAAAGPRAAGATAVVTLEPCNHTGRTPPCARALVAAGVRRVVIAQPDPNPTAQGGTDTLRAAGIEVVHGLLTDEARQLNEAWTFGLTHGRPMVTWKYASTLDGFSAATDGTSQWISNAAARRDVHRLRTSCDVVLAGTGTVLADDPRLTVRDDRDATLAHQPLRAVMGERDVPATSRVLDDTAETVLLRTRNPHGALATLFDLGRRHVFLEGGPTIAAAFLTAGLVDRVVAYLAPSLLGAGARAVGDLGIGTLTDALAFEVDDVHVVGADDAHPANVRLTLSPRRKS